MVRPVQMNPLVEASRVQQSRRGRQPAGAGFAQVLAETTGAACGVRFSGHALQRMEQRGISLTNQEQTGISNAVDQAAAKGSRESLLLMDRCSLVVSVPNRTVITVVPRDESRGAVFTNIDSAVMVPAGAPNTK